MENKLRLKILLAVLVFLLLASGIFLATTKFRSGSDNSGSVTVSSAVQATDSAKLTEEPKKETAKKNKDQGEVSGAIINTPVATPQQNTQRNTQTSKPDESGKIASLNDLLLKMTGAATDIHLSSQRIVELYGKFVGVLDLCETMFPNVTDPFTKEELIGECVEIQFFGINADIDILEMVRDGSLVEYRKWESQAGQIISSCSATCTDIWNAYVKGLTSLGISLP